MLDTLLQIIAPHHCYGCGMIGPVLCDNCKYDIIDEAFSGCIVCRRPCRRGICRACKTYYDEAWCVGERTDTLRQLIDGVKFHHLRATDVFVDLLDRTLPSLPDDTIVVPIPTTSRDVRLRGYGHVEAMTQRLARIRGLTYSPILKRRSSTRQRGAGRNERFEQGKRAFMAQGDLDVNRPYLLIDDVFTTGATVQFAAKQLRDRGARSVWVAVVSRQPLDK